MTIETYVSAFFIALYGLAIGSFLNVLIYRLPRGKSVVTGGSACPGCGRPIRWYDNLPLLSYLFLRGKCRTCNAPISYRYPAVELMTAVLFVAIFWQLTRTAPFGAPAVQWTPAWTLRLAAYLWFGAALVAVAFIDAAHKLIPNKITLPTFLVGMILLIAADPGAWSTVLLGVAAGGGSLLLLRLISPLLFKQQGMGMGDVKLGAVMGVFLGWQLALIGIFLGTVLGALYGLPLMFGGKAKRRSTFPFGPFLAAGALLAFFVGTPLLSWYLGLFSL